MRRLACFFALGALLFGAKRALGPLLASAPPTLIVKLGPEASQADEERAIDEALLVEEAVRRGGALIDPVVRSQLLSAMRTSEPGRADPGDPDGDDDTLLARALSLGLHRADPVARQRLTFQAEQLLASEAPGEGESDQTLTDYLRTHLDRYQAPPQVRITQVFLSRALRGDQLDADAARIADVLRTQPEPSDLHALGDATLLPAALDASEQEIDQRFGPHFAAQLRPCAEGSWCGPVASVYGAHLVRIDARREAELPALSAVRTRVLADYLHDRRRERLRERLRALRAEYRIDVERLRS